MLSRRRFLASATLAAQSTRPPNIIVVLADDQGYGDLGCYGSPHIRTPHLDRMASEGLRCTDFYAQALCGPSRAALLTGCWPARNSLNFNHLPRARTGIHPDEITIPEALRPAGYATQMVGKWHLGDAPEFSPLRNGFDHWYGLPYSNDMWPYHPKVVRHGEESRVARQVRERALATGYDGQGQTYPPDWFPPLPLMRDREVVAFNPDQTRLTADYTAEAVRFVRENRSRPFFLYLAHSMPHVPLFPGASFAGRSLRGRYGDVIEELDDATGQLLAAVRELGIDQNTLVVYASDNGPWRPYGIDAGSAGPLRGAKGTIFEGGPRVPAIFRWPGKIRPGVTSEILSTIDLLPTFTAAAGLPAPTERIVDGFNLLPFLTGAAPRSPREEFFYFDTAIHYTPETGRPTNNSNLLAIRSGRWKCHINSGELYDLLEDVGETRDVARQHSEIVVRLRQRSAEFLRDLRAHTRPIATLPV